MVILSVTFLFFIAFIIWWLYGKDEDIKEDSVQEDLNNIDIFDAALAYDGEAEDNDAIAILLHIINKKLIRLKRNKILSTDYNYENATNTESAFIEALFGRSGEVRLKENKEKLCKAVRELKLRMNEEKNLCFKFFNQRKVCIYYIYVNIGIINI